MQLRTSDRPDAERAASPLFPTAPIKSKEASSTATNAPVAPAGSSGLSLLNKFWIALAGCALVYWYDFSGRNPLRLTVGDWIGLAVECVIYAIGIWALWSGFVHSGLLQKAKAVQADTVSKINPLQWKLEYQLAWIVACVLGAVVAMFYGFSHSQFGMPGAGAGIHFLFWLQQPEFYWHWALSGVLIAGLSFYLARLLKA